MRCVVDDCPFEPQTYEELNEHSRNRHMQRNPFKNGTTHRYPGADRAGDFIWWSCDTECPPSERVDGRHSWVFDGDNPYIICHYCGMMQDALDGTILREGSSTHVRD